MSDLAPPSTPFAGRIAAITGGAGDIGLATARHLGSLGATIALIDLDDAKLEAARAQLAADGITAHGWRCDVTDEAAVEATVAAIALRLGRVHHLFNNAGILGVFHPLLDYPTEDFDAIQAVNVRGAFLVLRA